MALAILIAGAGAGPLDTAASAGTQSDTSADTGWEKVTLAAVGDIMVHMPQAAAARDSSGNYDFAPAFKYVAPLLHNADIAIGNLETVLSDNRSSYRGYPDFCSPYEIACDLQRAGFSLMTTANNHSYDKGEKGVRWTLGWLDSAGLAHTGTARDSAEAAQPLIIETRGVRTAMLAYTMFLNGFHPPIKKAYLVNEFSYDKLRGDVGAARHCGADFVVCCLHFGSDYVRTVTRQQKRVADSVLALGVDLLLGSHPHVVTPMHIDSAGRNGVVYSLGNFFSNQRGGYKEYGTIAVVTLGKEKATGRCRVMSIMHEPTVVHMVRDPAGARCYRIIPLRMVEESDSMWEFAYLKASLQGKYREMMDHIVGADTGAKGRQ